MVLDLAKIRESIKERNIDCIVATSKKNVFYSAGSNIGFPLRVNPVILPLDGDPVFGVHANSEITAQKTSWIKDQRVYEGGEWLPFKVWKFIADVLTEKGVDKGKIGLELLNVPGLCLDYIREQLPSAEFVDVGHILDKMMSVKSAEELELLSKINMLTARAITVAFEMTRPGDTERQIARYLFDILREYGASDFHLHLGAGESTLEFNKKSPTDYKIKKGDMIHVDFSGSWKGFASDISRMAVVGEPDERQLKAHSVIVKAMWDTAEAMRNGATVLEVHNATRQSYESQGFRYPRVFIGHSQSRGGHENPLLGEAHGDWVLEPGMFFQLEPSLPMGDFRVHMEDSFIVREQGPAENVSEYRKVTGPQIIK